MFEIFLRILRITAFLFFLKTIDTQSFVNAKKIFQCKSANIDLCRHMPYNFTVFPNPYFANDEITLQNQAEYYKVLFNTRCNIHLSFFLCSVLMPLCPEQVPQAISSCRSVCEEVKLDCADILRSVGLQWPNAFECHHFRDDTTKMCMTPQIGQTAASLGHRDGEAGNLPSCPHDLIDLDPMDPSAKCALRCDISIMYHMKSKELVVWWTLILSVINAIATFITIFTFSLNLKRFQLPERCVLFMAICHFCQSIPLLLRAGGALPPERFVCARLHAIAPAFVVGYGAGYHNNVCITSFFFTYFFGTACVVWWTIFAFTWFLSASRKWVAEELDKRSTYFHAFAWGLASVLTILAVVFNKIDASELTGVCSVGNLDGWALLALVVLPNAIALLFGLAFAVGGFVDAIHERLSFKRRGMNTTKLDAFIIKMAIFVIFYGIASLLHQIAGIEQITTLVKWRMVTVDCKLRGGVYSGACNRPQIAAPQYRILQLAADAIVGFATLIWTLNTKNWRYCLFGSGRPELKIKPNHQILVSQSTVRYSTAGCTDAERSSLIALEQAPPDILITDGCAKLDSIAELEFWNRT